MRGVDARRTFLQYDSIFIEIALFSSVGTLQVFFTKMGKLMTMNCVHEAPL